MDIGGEIELDVDAAGSHGVSGDVERGRDDLVGCHGSTFGLLLPRHAEKSTHDACAALGSGADLQRRGLCVRVALLLEQHRPRDDNR